MRAKAIAVAVFAGSLYVAMLLATAVEVFLLDHYEGALGDRYDNFWLDALVNIPICVTFSGGFAIGLVNARHTPIPSIPSIWVAATALVACGLMFAFVPMGYYLPDVWQLRIFIFLTYCIAIGAGLAIALLALKARRHAA